MLRQKEEPILRKSLVFETMSYIFGIVDLKGTKIKEADLLNLRDSVSAEGFRSDIELSEHYGLGYCHFPGRDSRCRIYKYRHLILLADLRIYNLPYLRTLFDFKDEFEAFAKAFLKWDKLCGAHINGDFAVVVIDQLHEEVHLLRDHIGARPLTYCYTNDQLVFSSHEFGIAGSGLCSTGLSEEVLIRRLLRLRNDYVKTAFQNILKVVPGHIVSFSKAGKRNLAYWQPEKIETNQGISFNEAVIRLRQLVLDATASRIEPGRTGVHVSGGIDSTGVASILADHIDDKSRMIGYSWTPEEWNDAGEDQNEKEYIDCFSDEKGVPVHYLKLEHNEYAKDSIVPDFETMAIENPTIRRAGKDKVTTLFSGWGGDEFLSLTLRGVLNHFVFRLKGISLLKFIRKFGLKSSIYKIRTEVLPLLVPFGLLPVYRETEWSSLRLLKPSFIIKHWKLIFFHKRENVFGYGNRKKFILNLLKIYHLPMRMDSWSLYAERYGFVYKYPLLDKDVLEFWFSLPVRFTYEKLQSRMLYREVMKGILPESIRTRKDKSEILRIKYSHYNMNEGNDLLVKLFTDIPENEHLPYFRIKNLNNLLNRPLSDVLIKDYLHFEKLCFYLRNYELVKRYLS